MAMSSSVVRAIVPLHLAELGLSRARLAGVRAGQDLAILLASLLVASALAGRRGALPALLLAQAALFGAAGGGWGGGGGRGGEGAGPGAEELPLLLWAEAAVAACLFVQCKVLVRTTSCCSTSCV